ncbi:anti-sigma factor family protein [Candidatus Nitrospira nitrosa]|uniref:anti-sigma factor family protein n=1 Tax=Candidatus Nitrospira nitrosa TaxID=1742972 RepID=UPI000AB9A26C|nr:zf-HC2 domain-containing protein [Candidatus Nitrospira nitrosa]
MAPRRTSTRPRRSASTQRKQAHGKAHCLRILRQLSAYIDDELSGDICEEIRRHLGACPNCETFVTSLRQTVSLCRHSPPPTLSAASRAMIRKKILGTTHTR